MISLSIDDLSLDLVHFDEKYPRTIMTPTPNLEYSIFGTAIGDGPFFASKYIWTITTYLQEEDMDMLGAIYQEFDNQRRAFNLSNTPLFLKDTNQRIQEKTITRAIAPGTTPNDIGSYKSYYGVFKVFFNKPPEFDWMGVTRRANFSVVEV